MATEIGIVMSRIEPMGGPMPAPQEAQPTREKPQQSVIPATDLETETWNWPQAVGKVVTVVIVAAAIVAYSFWAKNLLSANKQADVASQGLRDFVASSSTKLSLENFSRLQTGMSRYDVEYILGYGDKTVAENEFGQGKDYHITTQSLEWQDGSHIIDCTFQNNKLVQKVQAGLE